MKIEWKVFHRRDVEQAEITRFFSLPLRRRQRKIIMPFGQGLISSDNLHEAGGEKMKGEYKYENCTGYR